MKRTKRFTACGALALLLVLAAACADAQPAGPLGDADVRSRVENAPDFPGQEAVILFEGRYLELKDGLLTTRVQRLTRLVTPWGLEHLSDPRLPYDSARQSLTVHACRTYQPDGWFLDSPANAYNDVTPGALALAVDFLTFREMVVTHTGLEPGVCIWLDYTIADTAPPHLPCNEVFTPQAPFPTVEYELVAAGDLFCEAVNPEPAGPVTIGAPERDGDTRYWRLSELPARPGEAETRLGDQIPRLVVSALDSWEEFANVLRERLILAAEASDGVGDWLADLERDAPFLGDRDALRACTEAIADRTSLIGYEPAARRAAIRPVSRVLETSTATPLERLALLMAAANQRGIATDLLFVADDLVISRDVPALALLGEPCLTLDALADAANVRFHQPASGRVRERWEIRRDMPALAFSDGRAVWRDTADRGTRRFVLNAHLDLVAETARAGGYCSFDADLTGDPLRLERLLADWVAAWSDGAEIGTRATICSDRGFDYDIDATAPTPEPDDRGRTVVALPPPPFDLRSIVPPGMTLAHSQCRARLFPEAAIQLDLHWIVDLPEGMELLTVEGAGAAYPGARFTLERTLEQRRLTQVLHLDWDGGIIEPASYPAFRRFLLTVLAPDNTRIVLRAAE